MFRLLEVADTVGRSTPVRLDVGGLRRPARPSAAGDVLGQRRPRRTTLLLRRSEALRRGAPLRGSSRDAARRPTSCVSSTRTDPSMRRDDGRVIPEMVSAALAGRPLDDPRQRQRRRAASATSRTWSTALLHVLARRDARRRGLQHRQPARDHRARAGRAHRRADREHGELRFTSARPGDPERRRPVIDRSRARYGWEPRVAPSRRPAR